MSGIAPVANTAETRLPPEAHPPKREEADERRRQPPKPTPSEQQEGHLNVEA